MKVHVRKPGPALADRVEALWHFEAAGTPTGSVRRLPTGSMELVIDLHGDPLRVVPRGGREVREERGALICGAQSSFATSNASRTAIGVHFAPGGARPFFGIPLDELRDRHVPFDVAWGAEARALRDRLGEATSADARLSILERALVRRLEGSRRRHPAVALGLEEMVASAGTARVRDLARASGLSERRFARLFGEEIGLTPKCFGRIRRLQATLRSIGTGARVDWAGMAALRGYYDQAHLILEFRDLCGVTPLEYLARRGPDTTQLAAE